jgi:hypothetical protein
MKKTNSKNVLFSEADFTWMERSESIKSVRSFLNAKLDVSAPSCGRKDAVLEVSEGTTIFSSSFDSSETMMDNDWMKDDLVMPQY